VIFVNGLPLGVIELKNAADEDADIFFFVGSPLSVNGDRGNQADRP
jgi:type I site-specific restriction-modification system R (restriction) subunit